jgi:hypothetical protein
LFPIQTVLCGWYIYLAVLCGLMSASAGRGTWLARLGWLGVLASLLLLLTLYGTVSLPALAQVTLGAKFVPLAAGLLALAFAPRQDTKLIGLLLAGATALPIYLHFTG